MRFLNADETVFTDGKFPGIGLYATDTIPAGTAFPVNFNQSLLSDGVALAGVQGNIELLSEECYILWRRGTTRLIS